MSMVMLTLTQRMGIEPILCVCVLLPLLLLFSNMKTQKLMLCVNGPVVQTHSLHLRHYWHNAKLI